jgi:GT2 family glycosyltransferase
MLTMRPGHRYDHHVYDNGSVDGTREYLTELVDAGRIKSVTFFGENRGLSYSFNRAWRDALDANYDLVMNVDNDAQFKTRKWLKKLVNAHKVLSRRDSRAVISPVVKNLRHPPGAWGQHSEGGFRFGFVDILGGISRLIPAKTLADMEMPDRLPLAWGQDQAVAYHCATKNIPMAYVYNVVVRHMMTDDEQQDVIPAYMQRKGYERYIPYGL